MYFVAIIGIFCDMHNNGYFIFYFFCGNVPLWLLSDEVIFLILSLSISFAHFSVIQPSVFNTVNNIPVHTVTKNVHSHDKYAYRYESADQQHIIVPKCAFFTIYSFDAGQVNICHM